MNTKVVLMTAIFAGFGLVNEGSASRFASALFGGKADESSAKRLKVDVANTTQGSPEQNGSFVMNAEDYDRILKVFAYVRDTNNEWKKDSGLDVVNNLLSGKKGNIVLSSDVVENMMASDKLEFLVSFLNICENGDKDFMVGQDSDGRDLMYVPTEEIKKFVQIMRDSLRPKMQHSISQRFIMAERVARGFSPDAWFDKHEVSAEVLCGELKRIDAFRDIEDDTFNNLKDAVKLIVNAETYEDLFKAYDGVSGIMEEILGGDKAKRFALMSYFVTGMPMDNGKVVMNEVLSKKACFMTLLVERDKVIEGDKLLKNISEGKYKDQDGGYDLNKMTLETVNGILDHWLDTVSITDDGKKVRFRMSDEFLKELKARKELLESNGQ